MKQYEAIGIMVPLSKAETEQPKGFKCGTFGASSIEVPSYDVITMSYITQHTFVLTKMLKQNILPSLH